MVWWRAIRGFVARLFLPGQLVFASAQMPVSAEYPVDNSMSTLARFPWVYTCVQAIAGDQAGRPLVAHRPGRGGAKPVEVPDPALDLLAQPNAGSTGYLLRKQLWVDYLLTGNAYLWRPLDGGFVAVYRLHPRSVRPLPGPLGMAAGYEWTSSETGQRRVLTPDEVIHVRDVSWQDSTSELLGESAVRCLHDDLTADLGLRQQSAAAGSLGRPDIMFSSKTQLGEDGAAKLVERWTKAMLAKARAFVVGGEITATPLSWSPEELGQLERSNQVRDTILAVFGVPPSRAGLPGANYATARQEEKAYWERLQGRARVFDDAFSRLASPGVRIEHDYAGIEALQASYSERLARVQAWVALGWTPEQAAEYEGFSGLPPRPAQEQAPAAAPPVGGDVDEEPNEPADRALGAVRGAIALWLRCTEATYADLGADVDTRLVVRWHAERLFAALVDAGVERTHARWWADELAATTDEAHRMGLSAFDEARAERAAASVCARRAA